MKTDDRRGSGNRGERRGPRAEGRFEGPGRRTYGGGRGANDAFGGPRVGRVARNVPPARQADADGDDGRTPRRADAFARRDNPRRDDLKRDNPYHDNPRRGDSYRDNPYHDNPHRGNLHRGGAWRSESGPGRRAPAAAAEAEAPLEALAAEFEGAGADLEEHLLAGRNPIREALKAGRPVEKLLVAEGDLSGTGREIVRLAKAAGAVVQTVDRARLDRIYPAHQGMLAYVAAAPYAAMEDILAAAREKGEDPFIVILDGITDPHNLGAIIRSAECAGAHGVVLPERRSAGLSPAAAKAAAGALNHMPVARVTNLNRAIDDLKAQGVWIVGTAMAGEDAFAADLTGPVALVIGSEGEGISRLTLEKCDRTVSLPMKGRIESLNASVAAGILMYEILRQRQG